MAIKNRITVGLKQILEVDANPMLSATPAPIGSHAMWQDGAIGKAYLKTGAGDTDWMAYQVGNEPADWRFTTDANNLNEATAKAYFGTKSGSDFDIAFRRNGQNVFTLLQNSEVQFDGDISFSMFSGKQIKAYSGQISVIAPNLSFIAFESIDQKIHPDVVNTLFNITKRTVANVMQIPDASSSQAVSPYNDLGNNTNRMYKIKIMLHALSGVNKVELVMEKTLHVSSDNTILLQQDDFTSKNSFASSVQASISLSGGSNIPTVTFSGLSGLTGKRCVVETEATAYYAEV